MNKEAYDAARVQARKTAGICWRCDQPSYGKLCETHRRLEAERVAKHRADCLNEGRCRDCTDPVEKGKTLCSKHRTEYTRRKQEYWQSKRAAGICTQCESAALQGNCYCEMHYFKVAARMHLKVSARWVELRDLWVKQEGKCAYTKLPLMLGVNTAVDHIRPRSKGGVDDILNLCWTSDFFNNLKSDYTLEELAEQFRQNPQGLYLAWYDAKEKS